MPRLKILEILERNIDHHMSADDVYQYLRDEGIDIAPSTVYRVLTQFEAAGMVSRHHSNDKQARFELDGGDNLDRIICVRSGHVAKFKGSLIEQRLLEIANELGYECTDHSIFLYGVQKTKTPYPLTKFHAHQSPDAIVEHN